MSDRLAEIKYDHDCLLLEAAAGNEITARALLSRLALGHLPYLLLEIERLRPLARLGEAVEAMPVGAELEHHGEAGSFCGQEWGCVWPHKRGWYNLMNRRFGETPQEAMRKASTLTEET